MNWTTLAIFFLLMTSILSGVQILPANAQSQAIIVPNHTGYLDNATIPATYHVVGEVSNAGSTSINLVNVTANFYAEDNSLVGSSSSYALLEVLLPSRRAPFEVVWVGASASQIYNYSLSLGFGEYSGERPIALQILQNTVYTDEAGFLKVNGTISNLAISNATAVRVIAPFYDSQGKLLGIASGYTLPATIMPGQTEDFEIELPRKVSSFSDYRVTAESAEYEAIGTQVTINYGAAYTTMVSVTLILSSNDPLYSIAQMCFSNDNATFTNWEPYVASRSWTLPEGDGPKTVDAQFMDSTGSISPVYFDTIILDTTPPTITITYPVNASEIAFSTLVATWTGFDATSGINNYEVRMDNDSWINLETNTTQTFSNLNEGQHMIYFKITDRAGLSNQESVSFTVTSNPLATTALEVATATIAVVLAVAIVVYFAKIRKPTRRARRERLQKTISNPQKSRHAGRRGEIWRITDTQTY